MKIIDTPYNTSSRLSCLGAADVHTIIRYYNFSNSRNLPDKRLTLAEAQAISAQGMQIAVVFQQRQNQLADFSRCKGLAAGRRAFRYAQDDINQPAHSAIYFAVDFDASSSELENNIAPYFAGVKQAFTEQCNDTAQYRIGAYGSGLVCETLLEQGLSDLTWLSMSTGYRGTREALAAGKYNLAQQPPSTQLCGIGVDYNNPNPQNPDFGAFTVEDDALPDGFTTINDSDASDTNNSGSEKQYKVIARSGLRLRGGPAINFDIISVMRSGQVVFVISINEGWASIDIEGDGQIDGFASAAFLQQL